MATVDIERTNSINTTIQAGSTKRYILDTMQENAIRVDVSGSGQPYDIDIKVGTQDPFDGQVDDSQYVSALAQGATTISDTAKHSVGTTRTRRWAIVEITNNDASSIQVLGSTHRHSRGDSHSAVDVAASTPPGVTGATGLSFFDGKAMAEADSLQSTLSDIGQLSANLDAGSNDITNVGALNTEQVGITKDVILSYPRLSGGGRAGAFESTPISNHSDIAAALNSVLDAYSSNGIMDYQVFIAASGKKRVSSGKITIPNNVDEIDVAPAIYGPGRGVLQIIPAADFPDNRLLEVESAVGTRGLRGLEMGGFSLDDTSNDVLTSEVLKLNDVAHWHLRDMLIDSANASRLLYNTETGNGDDWGTLENVMFRGYIGGQTAFKSDGNFMKMLDCVFNGSSGDPTGTCIDVSASGSHFIHADFSNSNVGIDGLGGAAVVRFENPSNFNTTVKTTKSGQPTITVLNGNRLSSMDVFRHSEDKSPYTTWHGCQLRLLPSGSWSGGGAAVPNKLSVTGAATMKNGYIEIAGSSGNNARLDTGGNSPILNTSEQTPKMVAHGEGDNSDSARYRCGLVESRWSDWAGVEWNENGSNMSIVAKEGGANVGSSPVSVSDVDAPFAVSVFIKADATTIVSVVEIARDTKDAATESFSFASALATPDPTHALINDSTGTRHIEARRNELYATPWR